MFAAFELARALECAHVIITTTQQEYNIYKGAHHGLGMKLESPVREWEGNAQRRNRAQQNNAAALLSASVDNLLSQSGNKLCYLTQRMKVKRQKDEVYDK